jgi:sporulation protein YlmC with PRC-barrel domain
MNEPKAVFGSTGTDPVAAGMSAASESLPGNQASQQGGARIVSSAEEDHVGPGPRVMAAGTLEGDDVVNAAGDKLGTLDEIMLDVPSGRIAYAVLSSGGFLGIGDKLFAIPWRALTLDADNECFVLDVSKERLEQAPGFDKDDWPSMANESWAREVHTYYQTRPYWE